ncbi:MAG: hypothetical protein M1469_10245 [Bacteroidetes bacterium]|nr:hypothetical protein [Bacteroidota bacterium]
MKNIGKYIAFYGNPLPGEADLGWNVEVRLRSRVASHSCEWFSFAWLRQADASLLSLDSSMSIYPSSLDTTFNYFDTYKDGLGDFRPYDNLFVGRPTGDVGIRRRWQIGLAEFIYIRGGSITDQGQPTYSTFGWGARLEGLLKLLVFMHWLDADGSVAKFVLNHLDLQFDYSRAYGGIYGGKPFEDLNIVVR